MILPKLAVWLLLCTALANAAVRYVVLISVDGLAAFYMDDPRARLPTLRRLAREGARARGMVVTFPSSTWPSHVTLATGVTPARHGVLGNSVFDRSTGREVVYIGDPEFTKSQCVRAPTVYDVAHQAGLKTASVIWPATAGADTLDWAIPDTGKEAVLLRHTTRGLPQELEAAGIPFSAFPRWGWNKEYSGPRDLAYTSAAEYLLRRHQPNLTMLHLITPDGHQHSYGPRSAEAYWAVAYADERVRQIRDALQRPPFAGNSALFVVSDHGFAEYDKVVFPNVLLKEMGLIATGAGGTVTRRRAWFADAGVYLLDRTHMAEQIAALKPRLAALEGVDRVISPEQFRALGLPDPSENPQQADLMLSAKPGYSFSGSLKGGQLVSGAGGRRGTHGHLPDQPFAHAVFVAACAGIRRGVQMQKISSLDVAPTVAAALGLKMPGAEGRVLREILQSK